MTTRPPGSMSKIYKSVYPCPWWNFSLCQNTYLVSKDSNTKNKNNSLASLLATLFHLKGKLFALPPALKLICCFLRVELATVVGIVADGFGLRLPAATAANEIGFVIAGDLLFAFSYTWAVDDVLGKACGIGRWLATFVLLTVTAANGGTCLTGATLACCLATGAFKPTVDFVASLVGLPLSEKSSRPSLPLLGLEFARSRAGYSLQFIKKNIL